MAEKTYTLAQIKAAFWKEFHESGEQWFPYGEEAWFEKGHNEKVTGSYWDSFVEHLNEASNDANKTTPGELQAEHDVQK